MLNLRYLFENLFINKYELVQVKRPSNNSLNVRATIIDDFGRKAEFDFYFFSGSVDREYIEKFRVAGHNAIMIGQEKSEGIDFSLEEFYDKLKTTIDPGVYLNANLLDILNELGHNKLPNGMKGDPPDLFEYYTKDCLQFLFGGKGRRYGKERSFESVPDGAIMVTNRLTVLFDSKAYKDGFNVSADDIKRFESYVNDFNRKYSGFTEKVFSFLVLSGHFTVGKEALQERSKEMYVRCQTQLTFISAVELANSIKLLIDNVTYIDAINWKKILVNPIYSSQYLVEEIATISKDKIT